MNDIIQSEQQRITRKQFLSVLGAAIGSIVLAQFMISPKDRGTAQANTYGNSTYGNTKA